MCDPSDLRITTMDTMSDYKRSVTLKNFYDDIEWLKYWSEDPTLDFPPLSPNLRVEVSYFTLVHTFSYLHVAPSTCDSTIKE